MYVQRSYGTHLCKLDMAMAYGSANHKPIKNKSCLSRIWSALDFWAIVLLNVYSSHFSLHLSYHVISQRSIFGHLAQCCIGPLSKLRHPVPAAVGSPPSAALDFARWRRCEAEWWVGSRARRWRASTFENKNIPNPPRSTSATKVSFDTCKLMNYNIKTHTQHHQTEMVLGNCHFGIINVIYLLIYYIFPIVGGNLAPSWHIAGRLHATKTMFWSHDHVGPRRTLTK